jgi:hypothetical protein
LNKVSVKVSNRQVESAHIFFQVSLIPSPSMYTIYSKSTIRRPFPFNESQLWITDGFVSLGFWVDFLVGIYYNTFIHLKELKRTCKVGRESRKVRNRLG